MGKAAIILALGISIIISLLIIDLNANNNNSVDTTVELYEETQSRLIANAGVEIYLEKLRRDKSLKGSFAGNTFNDGEYQIDIYGPDTLLKIKSTASFGKKNHTVLVTAKRSKVPIPDVHSSVFIASNNLELNLNGNMEIDGRDRNIDGSFGTDDPLPGIIVESADDSANFINKVKPNISGSIQGLGGSPSIRTSSDNRDWNQIAEDFIFAADITLASGNYSSGTQLGSWDNPKITVVNGDVHLTGDSEGYGILVVNGNLTMSGNFTYRGLVIAYGESTLDVKTVGNAGIYGGTVFVGESVNIQATGNAKMFYSSQAITNAQNKLKSSRFDIVSWWE